MAAAPTTLYDYYSGKGQALPSVSDRAPLYEAQGLGAASTYTGTASQNTALLGKLLAGGSPAPSSAPSAPQTADQVQPYLSATQAALAPSPEVRTPDAITADLTAKTQVLDANGNPTARPTPPSLLDTFTNLKGQYGVTDLEQSLNTLKAQVRDIQGTTEQRTNNELNKPVPVGVIAGRTTEVQRQQQEQLDSVNRNIAYVTDQLNTAYNGINMIMQFTQQDWQNASAAWDSAYNRNVQMIGLVQGEQKLEADQQQQATDNARANLNTYIQLITSNNLSYGQLTPDQKVQITKLEVQSGLPIGFTSSIQGTPISTSPLPDGRIQVLTRDSNGVVQTQIYGTATKSASGLTANEAANLSLSKSKADSEAQATQYKNYVSSATTIIKGASPDKWVDANEWAAAYKNILGIVGDPATAHQVALQAFNEAGKEQYGQYAM